MASSMKKDSLLDNIREMIQCEICQQIKSSPRLLPCLHSFCEECVESLVLTQHSDSPVLELPGMMIPCPTCTVPCVLTLGKIRDLETDFNVQQLIDLHHKYKFKDPCIKEALPEISCSRCDEPIKLEAGKPVLENQDDSEVVKDMVESDTKMQNDAVIDLSKTDQALKQDNNSNRFSTFAKLSVQDADVNKPKDVDSKENLVEKAKEVPSSPPKVCLMWNIVLCGKCASSHSRKNEKHYEVDVTQETWKVLFCEEHSFKIKTSYCMEESCKTTLCSVCLLSDQHEDHEIVFLPDVMRNIQEKIHRSNHHIEAYERDWVKIGKSMKEQKRAVFAGIEEEAGKRIARINRRKDELEYHAMNVLKETWSNNMNMLYNIHRGEWFDSVQKCKDDELDKDLNQVIKALQNKNHPIFDVISFDFGDVEETSFEVCEFVPSDGIDMGCFKIEQKVVLQEPKPDINSTDAQSKEAPSKCNVLTGSSQLGESEEENGHQDCSESSGQSQINCDTDDNDNARIIPIIVETGPNPFQFRGLNAPIYLKIHISKEPAAEEVCHSKIDNSNKSTGLKCDNADFDCSSVVRFNSSRNDSDETSDEDVKSHIQVVGAESRDPEFKGEEGKSVESKMLQKDLAESGLCNYFAFPNVFEDLKSSQNADKEKKTNAPETSMSFEKNLESNCAANEAQSTSIGLSGTTHKTTNPNATKAETSEMEKDKSENETKK